MPLFASNGGLVQRVANEAAPGQPAQRKSNPRPVRYPLLVLRLLACFLPRVLTEGTLSFSHGC